MRQLESIVRNASACGNGAVPIQILDEIVHADLSKYLPLKSLHNIIDNGFEVSPGKRVKVTIFGITNYNIDSAKLNRGITILRALPTKNSLKDIAKDVFKSSVDTIKNIKNIDPGDEFINKIQKNIIDPLVDLYVEEKKEVEKKSKLEGTNLAEQQRKYLGLRDFYLIYQNLAYLLLTNPGFSSQKKKRRENPEDFERLVGTLIRNFWGDMKPLLQEEKMKESIIYKAFKTITGKELQIDLIPPIISNEGLDIIKINQEFGKLELRNPIYRHLLITDENGGLDVLNKLQEHDILNSSGSREKFSDHVHVFFSKNLTGNNEYTWIADVLSELTKAMKKGETVIFIGQHPAFRSLYDIFNMRYELELGKDNSKIYKSLISCGGDSYPVTVHPEFRVFILMDIKDYQSKTLSAPFLNRFEKVHFSLLQKKEEYVSEVEKLLREECLLRPPFWNHNSISSAQQMINDIDSNESSNIDCIAQALLLGMPPSQAFWSFCQQSRRFNEKAIQFYNMPLFSEQCSSMKTSINLFLEKCESYFSGETNCSMENKQDILLPKLLERWKSTSSKGIQAVLLVPEISPELRNPPKSKYMISLNIESPDILVQLDNAIHDLVYPTDNNSDNSNQKIYRKIVLIVDDPDKMRDTLPNIMWHMKEERVKYKEEPTLPNCGLNFLIVISLKLKPHLLQLNQSISWPIIALDRCLDNLENQKENVLPFLLTKIPIDRFFNLSISEFISKNGKFKTFGGNDYNGDYQLNDWGNEFLDVIQRSVKSKFTRSEFKIVNKTFQDKMIIEFLLSHRFNINELKAAWSLVTPDPNKRIMINLFWTYRAIKRQQEPPRSLTEFFMLSIIDLFANYISGVISIVYSGENAYDEKKRPSGKTKSWKELIKIFKDVDLFCKVPKYQPSKVLSLIIANVGQISQKIVLDLRFPRGLNSDFIDFQLSRKFWSCLFDSLDQVTIPEFKDLLVDKEKNETLTKEEKSQVITEFVERTVSSNLKQVNSNERKKILEIFEKWNQTNTSALLDISWDIIYNPDQYEVIKDYFIQDNSLIRIILEFLIPQKYGSLGNIIFENYKKKSNYFNEIKIFLNRLSPLIFQFQPNGEEIAAIKKFFSRKKIRSFRVINELSCFILDLYLIRIFKKPKRLDYEELSILTQFSQELSEIEEKNSKDEYLFPQCQENDLIPKVKAIPLLLLLFNFLKSRNSFSNFIGLARNSNSEYIQSLVDLMEKWNKKKNRNNHDELIKDWLNNAGIKEDDHQGNNRGFIVLSEKDFLHLKILLMTQLDQLKST